MIRAAAEPLPSLRGTVTAARDNAVVTTTAARFTVPALLGEALDGSARPCPVDPGELAELLAWFRAECEAAVARSPADTRPLRLPKGRVTDLLACERGALARLGDDAMGAARARGRITDLLVAQHATIGLTPDVRADVLDALGALGPDGAPVLGWLAGASEEEAAELWRHAEVVAACLAEGWGALDRAWWPRCQERATVVLAGGALVLSATFDLVVGGPPTDRPWVVVEVKSGQVSDRHRTDLLWYALVAALRHGRAPAWVATWTAADDGLVPLPVTLGTIEAAAHRGLAALDRLVGLAAGRAAGVTPHAGCGWCPELDRCEPGLARVAGLVDGPWPGDAAGLGES